MLYRPEAPKFSIELQQQKRKIVVETAVMRLAADFLEQSLAGARIGGAQQAGDEVVQAPLYAVFCDNFEYPVAEKVKRARRRHAKRIGAVFRPRIGPHQTIAGAQ